MTDTNISSLANLGKKLFPFKNSSVSRDSVRRTLKLPPGEYQTCNLAQSLSLIIRLTFWNWRVFSPDSALCAAPVHECCSPVPHKILARLRSRSYRADQRPQGSHGDLGDPQYHFWVLLGYQANLQPRNDKMFHLKWDVVGLCFRTIPFSEDWRWKAMHLLGLVVRRVPAGLYLDHLQGL